MTAKYRSALHRDRGPWKTNIVAAIEHGAAEHGPGKFRTMGAIEIAGEAETFFVLEGANDWHPLADILAQMCMHAEDAEETKPLPQLAADLARLVAEVAGDAVTDEMLNKQDDEFDWEVHGRREKVIDAIAAAIEPFLDDEAYEEEE